MLYGCLLAAWILSLVCLKRSLAFQIRELSIIGIMMDCFHAESLMYWACMASRPGMSTCFMDRKQSGRTSRLIRGAGGPGLAHQSPMTWISTRRSRARSSSRKNTRCHRPSWSSPWTMGIAWEAEPRSACRPTYGIAMASAS